MIQEDKDLLLKDLCARLPYGVMCQVDDGAAGLNDGKLVEIDISKELVRFDADYYWDAYIDDVKPYLRSMSSITTEEDEDRLKSCLNIIQAKDTMGIITETINTKWLKSLKERVQSKHEWSEETSNKINSIKYLLHELGNHNFDNWLESIKDSALSKQEWGEEDEKIYQSIMDDTVQENQLDRKQIDWLKLIKERLK